MTDFNAVLAGKKIYNYQPLQEKIMKKIKTSPLAAAMGVAFVSALGAASVQAEANPFGVNELTNGYMQVAEAGKAQEMACGANMPGMDKPKTAEGACAGNKPAAPAAAPKAGEGKCGEGMCAAMMNGDKMKKGMESTCGAMMKGKEGACGAGAAGADMKMPEGKCASQCGEGMKNCPDAKAKEGACGAKMQGCGEAMQGCPDMMKGKEGACAAMAKPAAPVPAVPAPTK